MALLAFPSPLRWHNFPIEGRHTIDRLINRSLEDFPHPFWKCAIMGQNSFDEIIDDKENFSIQMDVSHFRPEELSVMMQDGRLFVEGHHKEQNNQHNSVEEHFIRKYTVPKTVLQDSLESQLSDQGILRITAKKAIKNIPIQIISTNGDKQ